MEGVSGVSLAAKRAELPQATVAIVLRTKNRPLLLARALESALAQTYRDYTVVVVNDAGQREPVDQAVDAVAGRADGRIHVVHNEVSAGREAAINTGLHSARSTFVTILDDDDTWHPEFLSRVMTELSSSEQHGVAVRSEVIYERIDGVDVIETGRELLATDKRDINLVDMLGRNYMPTNSLVYRRDVHDAVGEYDESLPVLADWEFYLRFLTRFEIGFLDGPPLAFWHHRPSSVGDEGNSVQAGIAQHVLWDARIRDRYLRTELAANDRLGTLLYIGELFNRDREIDQDRAAHLAGAVHELRDLIGGDLLRRVGDVDTQLTMAVQHLTSLINDEVLSQLQELNRNLVSQNNRLVARFQELRERVDELEAVVVDVSLSGRLRSAGQAAKTSVDRLFRRSG